MEEIRQLAPALRQPIQQAYCVAIHEALLVALLVAFLAFVLATTALFERKTAGSGVE